MRITAFVLDGYSLLTALAGPPMSEGKRTATSASRWWLHRAHGAPG